MSILYAHLRAAGWAKTAPRQEYQHYITDSQVIVINHGLLGHAAALTLGFSSAPTMGGGVESAMID